MSRILALLLAIILLPGLSIAQNEPASTVPTQSDLAIGLVDSLGWSFGLPDNPDIDDYLTILKGRRTWRYEIEDIYKPSAQAPLLPKDIRTFGPFSGKEWQRGPNHEIVAELDFLVPLSGEYEIRVALTKPGYQLSINENRFSADGKRNFSEVTFGNCELTAGLNKAFLTVPPRGGLDYLLLVAPPAPPIEPLHGWAAEKPLNAADLAVVVSRVLSLESYLQPLDATMTIEAEEAPVPKNASLSDDRYQGPMQGKWIKAGMNTAHYEYLFNVAKAGVYDFTLNILGREAVDGLINGREHFSIEPRPYFTEIPAGSFYLEKGTNQIEIDLPPRTGLDRIDLHRRSAEASDYLRLTGLRDGEILTRAQLDKILRLLAAIGVRR